MSTYKIVLTGGPCGGKTYSIPFLTEKISEQNYSVKIVNETANSLLNLGYMPNVNISPFDFQNLLFKIQFINEYNSEGKSDVLLCDRGIFDGKVYLDSDNFLKLLYLNRVDEEKILSTYDGALYYRSISHEYPDTFRQKRIYESPKIGRIRDELSKEIWADKIISCNYNNLDGFDNKQEIIFLALKNKLELLANKRTYNLSDYYDYKLLKYIYDGINDILIKNKISKYLMVRTKGLIR